MLGSLIDGGPFAWILLVCSVVAVAFILERALALRRQRILPSELETMLDKAARPEDLTGLRMAAEASPSPLGRLLLTALDHLPWSKDENVAALEVKARQEVVRMERGLVVLEVMTGIAPLLGLVGTIYGIIPLFGDFGNAVGNDNTLLAKGIAAALNKTLMGLMVAIPSLVAWSYFNKRVETLAVDLEAQCDTMLRRYYLRPQAGIGGVTAPRPS